MPGPGDQRAAPRDERTAAAGGLGHLRASRADRERVIELLKVAFVQDRLTQDELAKRVGLALASRTYAELADLTADIPTGIAVGIPAGPDGAEPARMPARTLARAACRSGICMLVVFAMVGVIALTNTGSLMGPAFLCGVAAAIAASGFLGYGVVDAWQQGRSRGQLPPRPRRDRRGLEDGRPVSTRRDPASARARTDHTRVDLRTHQPERNRRRPSWWDFRAPRGVRPIPGAV
jgi:hypothetical protein